jgi:ribulose-5-phosphate 4-epimerase/fuculose-1-phosphate aldolase
MKKKPNDKNKKELVDFFKILDYFKINDLTANHASILSSDGNGFFMNQHQYLFSQIKVKNLVYVDLKSEFSKKYSNINKAGFYIHKFIHNSNYRPKAILHTHSINSVAISCLKEGFNEKLNQSSMRFFRRIEYLNYSGMVIDKKIGNKLAKIIKKNTKVIILKNHGSIIFADTIEELFHLTFHFEKCCNIQLSIKNQSKINKVSDAIAKLTCDQHEGFGLVGAMSWKASKKLY